MDTINENIIEGRNAVIEAMKAGRQIDKIYLARGLTDKTIGYIASNARAAGIAVTECDRRKLDAMSTSNGAHQGVIAVAAAREYCDVEDILALAESRQEDPFIVVCDGLEDPRNLGAVIRCAECAGAHGVIIPRHHSVGITASADKASAGAAEHMLISKVTNISTVLQDLKKKGLWVYGAEADGNAHLWKTDMKGPICLVIGSEGKGISRLVRENCDFIVDIPMAGKVNSLNASAAAAILLYEVVRQRHE